MSESVNVQQAKLLTFYLPLRKLEDIPKKRLEKISLELREAGLEKIVEIFEGSTYVRAYARTEKWGNELTYVFNVIAFESPSLRRNAEILGWVLLETLDGFKKKLHRNPEEKFWFTEHEITLYEIENPNYRRSSQ